MKRILAALLFIAGCSSISKVNYDASTNPHDAATTLEQDISQGYTNHYDVLAQKDFDESQDYLKKAKREMSKNEKTSDILESLGYSRAYLNRAKEKAEKLKEPASGILEARAAAIAANARNYPADRKALLAADDDMRAEVEDLAKGRTGPERYKKLQAAYLGIETHALQDSKLGEAKARIHGAIAAGAKKNTPNALSQAERDVVTAENLIGANRNDSATIDPAVNKANASSQMLVDTLAATKRPEGVVNEDAAKELVVRGRAANAPEVQLDKALESARKEFQSDEADVFRQGDKLLIRLKSIDFPVGRADLPSHSLETLAKVKNVAQDLKPAQITVEGHTDSTGHAEKNKALSEERAESVAQYLSTNGIEKQKITTVGYGFEKPIGSNKSKEGRAQNRRVDVILEM